MRVAIIGTGNVGAVLAGTLRRAGHEVVLAARDAAKTRQLAEQVDGEAAETPSDAVGAADVTILAVPYGALAEVAGDIREAAAGKVVIDLTNPGPAIESGASAAEQLAEMLPGAHVAKALNTLFSSFMADPDLRQQRVDALFATDSEEARDLLAELLASLGFRPLHVGGLTAARQMEAMAWLNIQLQLRHGGDWSSTFVLLGAPKDAVMERALITN
ncbi:NAD(P)-binding domain-containing protein [soil metagenome]